MLLAVDGLKLRNLREGLGMSRRECAKKAGVSEKTLNNLERCGQARPSTVKKVGRVLGVDPKLLAVPVGRLPALNGPLTL